MSDHLEPSCRRGALVTYLSIPPSFSGFILYWEVMVMIEVTVAVIGYKRCHGSI